jgi:hypothetical protein
MPHCVSCVVRLRDLISTSIVVGNGSCTIVEVIALCEDGKSRVHSAITVQLDVNGEVGNAGSKRSASKLAVVH